ncbi:MAG: hypothetical protein ACXVNM_13795 [Bacteroidia bacterium]
MKALITILFISLLVFSCKKKQNSTTETPAPAEENGILNITINSYDSLGNIEAKTYSTSVFLSGTSYSGTTDTNGKISFNVPPSTYVPSVIRPKYEGVPFLANVASNSITSVNSFVARNSPYVLTINFGNPVNQDSVTLSMNLNKSIPAGQSVKVAVLFGANSSVGVNSYTVFNQFNLTQTSNPNFNICKGAIKTAINQLPTNTNFFLVAVPVTYGNYYSNILNKNILVGDNLPTQTVPTASIQLTKTW